MEINKRLQEGIKAHQSGNAAAALEAYKAVLSENPDHPDGLHFLGLLIFNKEDPGNAIALIEHSLDLNPMNAAAHNNLANIFKLLNRRDEALTGYIRAVDVDPSHEEAWHNLSMLAGDDAKAGDILAVLGAITEKFPENPEAWCSYGQALRRAERPDEAAAALETALDLGIEPTGVAVRCARFLYQLGFEARSIAHLERLAEKYPDDTDAQFYLAAAKGDQPAHAPQAYIKAHFDNFAPTFDEVLTALNYDTPQLIADRARALMAEVGQPFSDVADLGCGSGLCGPLIRDISGKLSGVDLSAGMLQKAAGRKTYDFLIEGEIVAFLNADLPTQFDLCVCADTLIYFGDLRPFFDGLTKALTPGGRLLASVEALEEGGPPYRLHDAGRYGHTPSYLRQTAEAAGLSYGQEETVVLRKELGKDVKGLIFEVQKPDLRVGR